MVCPSPRHDAAVCYDLLTMKSGAGSYLSICSEPAVQWASERIGLPDFATSAALLVSTVGKKLKLQQNWPRDRAPNPTPETAWKYSNGLSSHLVCVQMGSTGC
jgi:hypothetical protein